MFRLSCLFLIWIEHMMICISVVLLGLCCKLVQFQYFRVGFASPFLVTCFWSIPVMTLWYHWPYSFFLDFVMARCCKYWDEAPRCLMFKTKHRKGSWACSFFPPPHGREQDAGCDWVLCVNCHMVVSMRKVKPGLSLEGGGITGSRKVNLAQKYLFFLL